MTDTPYSIPSRETVTSPFSLSGERMKGGEKRMASEWEELEKLSKEELIIELVKARRDMRNIRSVLGELSETGASSFMYDEGSKPSKDWLDRIVEYVDSRLNSDETLCAADLEMYGIDEETADRYVDAQCSKEGL